MPAVLPFEQKLLAAWPHERWRDVRVLAAVSGGPDSVALLRSLHRLSGGGPGLAVAHFNHGLRGEAALADQQFVTRLCRGLEIECRLGEAAGLRANMAGEGLEAAARLARYEFLQRTAEALGARYVATGHTLDDQAETMLHHIVRGTGLRGLAGMRRVRPLGTAVTLLRPMLAIRRGEVLEYLEALGQPYREDETNRQLSLTRNRIRNELLPLLARDYSPGIVESLVRLGALAADAQQEIDALAETLLDGCLLECNAGRVVLDCRQLATKRRHMVREVLVAAWRRQGWPQQAMGFDAWDQLAELTLADAPSEPVKRMFPGAIAVERSGAHLVFKGVGNR
jgi:tRNA(Ile)-lysidine synthase